MLIRTDRDAIAGGILQNVSPSEFNSAVEALYSEAREAIDKGHAVLPSAAHNAVLALRFSDDLKRAKEILDVSIKQYPDDENLRFQRAVVAYSENDPVGAIALLPDRPTNPEAIGILASALAATGKLDKALSLINDTDEMALPEHVKTGFVAVRTRAYVARGEKQLAMDIIAQQIAAQPKKISLRAVQISTHRLAGDEEGAIRAFDDALALVTEQTSLRSRLELCFEARKWVAMTPSLIC